MMERANALERVRGFWDTEACGTHFVKRVTDDRDFFAQYREFRYRTEWHIPTFAAFAESSGKSVLEIGCGNGADAAMFVASGARYTGVDLTAEAISATRRHFAGEGLEGELYQQNCELLSFAAGSFDIVYSFGVLHHTPAPVLAVREVHRVLKPGGVALVMLYHRHSFNYYVRILTYMRARVLLTILARRWRIKGRNHDARRARLRGVRGNDSGKVWDIHYANFLAEGWSYLKPSRFVHHCTDGPECPCAYTYSKREARDLFSAFRHVDIDVAHFPLNKYPGGRFVPRAVERWIAAKVGWHLLIRATK